MLKPSVDGIMNRSRKRKDPSLLDELKELELLEEGATVDIPDLEIEDLIEENSLSVIVRCLNPYVHKVGGLVLALPAIWGLEERVRGRGVGDNRAQFIFRTEGDLKHVLTKGPWFVNGWMVSLDQWSPNPPPEFLQRIPFWIRVRGLPLHMLKKEIVETLLGPLGRVEKVELHAKNSNSMEYVRALVHINTEEPLQFRLTARFRSGVTIPTELEYEKLLKVCFTCKRLSHDQGRCPMQISTTQIEEKEKKERSKGTTLKKKLQEKEFKAREALQHRSARGVVIRNQSLIDRQRGDNSKAQTRSKEDKRKGKRIVSTPQMEWKQKGERGASGVSKSTEESTANPESHEGKSTSVFNRLGSQEGPLGSDGSGERSFGTGGEEDLRTRLSGGSREEKRESKSSKGSRSPPNVFERLGGTALPYPDENRTEGSLSIKRRRQGSSEGRKTKKPRIGSQEKKQESPSVFLRLGGSNLGSEGSGSAGVDHSAMIAVKTPVHSARVAAHFPDHSVRRIVLASGSNLKEGLMGNPNPSRSI